MVRKIKAKLVLQLRAEGLSGRAIAASQQLSRNSVEAVLEAADAAEVSWDDVAALSDGEGYLLLFRGRGEHECVFAEPDWAEVHREMDREGSALRHGLGQLGSQPDTIRQKTGRDRPSVRNHPDIIDTE